MAEPQAAPTISVSSPGDLKRIVGAWRPGVDRDTSITLDFLPPGERRRRWESEFTAWYTDCGCVGGVIGALGLTIAYLLAAYAAGWIDAPRDWNGALITGGVFLVGTVAGKLAGFGHARIRLGALAEKIARAG